MKSNVQNLHITKAQILRKSGCVARCLAYTLSYSVLFVVFAKIFPERESSLLISLAAFFAIFIGGYCAYLAAKELLMVARIIVGKYTVVCAKVLSSRFANPYIGRNPSADRVLTIGDTKIVVSYRKAATMPVGSDVLVVKLNKTDTPIVIENVAEDAEKKQD